jgi:hypothetical protein
VAYRFVFYNKAKMIYVKTITGKTLTIDAEPSDWVIFVKVKILDIAGWKGRPNAMKLLGGARNSLLQNDRCLSDYGINDGDTIFIVMCTLRGPSFYYDSTWTFSYREDERTSLYISVNDSPNEKYTVDVPLKWTMAKVQDHLTIVIGKTVANMYGLDQALELDTEVGGYMPSLRAIQVDCIIHSQEKQMLYLAAQSADLYDVVLIHTLNIDA